MVYFESVVEVVMWDVITEVSSNLSATVSKNYLQNMWSINA